MFDRLRIRRSIKGEMKRLEDERIAEEIQRERFLSEKTDVNFLERMIQKCNSNPDLKVEIILKDGTILHLKTSPAARKRDFEYLNDGE